MKTVTAAILTRDDRILICQRRADQPHPLKWEFPGGKVEGCEEPAECLRRELREELGIEAEIGGEVRRMNYQYPGMVPLLLVFFRVARFSGEPRNLVFADMEWAPRATLADYDFLEADREIVAALARGDLL